MSRGMWQQGNSTINGLAAVNAESNFGGDILVVLITKVEIY